VEKVNLHQSVSLSPDAATRTIGLESSYSSIGPMAEGSGAPHGKRMDFQRVP